PTHAMRRHVALIDVEPVLPQQFSRVSVETHHAFLLGFAFAGGVLQVEVIAKDHWRGAAAIGRLPSQVLARERPLLRQTLLARDGVTVRTAPVGPIAN